MSLTPGQNALRQQGITGSEIATVAGLGKGSLWEIWARKIGEPIPETEDNDAMREGRHYEAALVEWVRLYHPRYAGYDFRYTEELQRTVRSASHPIVIATPDGVIYDEVRSGRDGYPIQSDIPLACIEAKKPSRYTWHEWSEDTYPERYLCQATWEMAAWEVREAVLVAHVVDRTQMYDIPYDLELFGYLLEAAERFWRDYVATKTPPPVDGSRQASEWLQRRFPRQREGLAIEADEHLQSLMKCLRGAEQQHQRIEGEIASLSNSIKERMGDAELLRAGDEWIRWRKAKDSEVLDLERVKRFLADNDLLKGFMTRREGGRRMTKSWTRGKE